MKTTPNPSLYRRMSEPHESQAAANEALGEFFKDLQSIREKHRIRDVVASVQMAYKSDVVEGGETVAQASLTIGSQMEAVGMVAVLYGTIRRDWQAVLDRAAEGEKG